MVCRQLGMEAIGGLPHTCFSIIYYQLTNTPSSLTPMAGGMEQYGWMKFAALDKSFA